MSDDVPVSESSNAPSVSEEAEYSYPELPPRDIRTLTPRQYIEERLNQAMIWYDKNSGKNKNARKEYFVFTAGEGPYTQVDAEEGFRLFVERVERVIESENAFTLQVLSTVPDTESQQQRTTTQ